MNEIKGRINAVDRIVGNIARRNCIAGTISTGGKGTGGSGNSFEDVISFGEDIVESVDKYRLITTVTAEEILDDTQKNLSNWSKNMPSFPQFDNTYSETDKSNNLQFMGGAGCERIYTAVNTEIGSTYSFEFDFKTSTGFVCQYGSDVDYAFVTSNASVATGTGGFTTSSAIGYAVLDNTASDTTSHYVIEFTATEATTYIGIDMGYMTDGVLTNLYFSNISVIGKKYQYRIESEE